MSELTQTIEQTTEEIEAILGNPKLSIKFDGKYKSITAFNWENIPDFAVITGINGTGKSQLLELIHHTIFDNPYIPERVVITGKKIERHEVTFLRGEWQLQGTGQMSVINIHQSREHHFSRFRNSYNDSTLRHNEPRLFGTFEEIVRKTGKQPSDLSSEEFYSIFPEVFVEEESQLSIKINEVFLKYRIDEINLLAQKFNEEEITEKLGKKPWDVLRNIIKTAKLPFNISDPSTNEIWDTFYLKLTHQTTNDDINFHDLSSGEKVLMSLVFYLYNSQEKGVFPKLFLLDEPDAHLHPSMSQQFINVMKKVLVDEMGVQVIMTTHSPSTVALAPEEAIFVANREGERIQKGTKDAALKLLTSGVPSFSIIYENRRQVFVESKYDVYFYEKIYRKISNYLIPDVSLSFISSGDANVDKHGQPISSCEQVIKVINVLRDAGNKFVWGIVDWDKINTESDFIKVLGDGRRYSIENYLFDPILVAAILLREKIIQREELALPDNATHIDFNNYSNAQLQDIANFIVDKVRVKINPKDETTENVQLLNGKSIDIPIWYLHHQGHDLENRLLEAFPKLNTIKAGKEAALKNAIIDKVIDDLPELISIDFLEVFSKLQEV